MSCTLISMKRTRRLLLKFCNLYRCSIIQIIMYYAIPFPVCLRNLCATFISTNILLSYCYPYAFEVCVQSSTCHHILYLYLLILWSELTLKMYATPFLTACMWNSSPRHPRKFPTCKQNYTPSNSYMNIRKLIWNKCSTLCM